MSDDPRIDGAKLGLEIAKVAWSLVEPTGELKAKSRWAHVTIFNKTQFPLKWTGDEYFESGRFWTAPTNVEPVAIGSFAVSNRDSAWTGVGAGAIFEVCAGRTAFKFGIGVGHPAFGDIKLGVTQTNSAETAYKSRKEYSTSCQHAFESHYQDGRRVKITLTFVASPAMQGSITITESHEVL